MVVMENLIKCGVRVHGGNGNGTLISKNVSDLLLEYFFGFFLSSSCSCCTLLEVVRISLLRNLLESLCLMMKRKDGLLDGEGGILWIGMYLFLRTKLPFPDREGLYLLKKHQECN